MAALTALPDAFFFSSAVLNGDASVESLRPAYSLATEMHWASRLSRAMMYIGVGWLFCVTLPAEIRYGIGVRICAPSMPLPSEPSTRLSRVVPHEACFCTSTSGMPYLAKMPFSLATNSGEASVSAMKPSLAPFTSGPAPCANAPAGKFNFAAASNAAVPPVACKIWRRLKPRREVSLVGFVIGAVRLVSPREAHRRAFWGGPQSGGVTIRMIGLEGRHQWRRQKLF